MTRTIRLHKADPAYPAGLKNLPDPPPFIELIGTLPALPMIAIVGSRAATAAAVTETHQMAGALADQGFGVISGGAIGIDTAAHEGALAVGGVTVAVLGSGLSNLYPERNRALFKAISGSGALLSTLPAHAPPRGWNFPRRNRLIAALARGVLVSQASTRSGSLHTASWARRLGLPVMALAGSPGCNRLIQQGAARVASAKDMVEVLRGGGGAPAPPAPTGRDQAALLELMSQDTFSLDSLAIKTGWSIARVALILIQLELGGFVEPLGGGRYRKVG